MIVKTALAPEGNRQENTWTRRVQVETNPTPSDWSTVLASKSDGELVVLQLDQTMIIAEVAKSSTTRARGLSGRAALDPNQGMLFVFPTDIRPGFWMKEMNFPLDFVWLDSNRQITGLTKNIFPDSSPKLFYPPRPIRYVLEINAGLSDQIGLKIGDRLTLWLLPNP